MELYYRDLISKDASLEKLVDNLMLVVQGAEEFAEATGVYIACLFVMFQVVNYLFFRAVPTPGVLVGGAFIVVGAVIIYAWR